jgi:hypothetical protein
LANGLMTWPSGRHEKRENKGPPEIPPRSSGHTQTGRTGKYPLTFALPIVDNGSGVG